MAALTSRPDAELAIFAWIEGWYNLDRRLVQPGTDHRRIREQTNWVAESVTSQSGR
jgi:hypothetical protein